MIRNRCCLSKTPRQPLPKLRQPQIPQDSRVQPPLAKHVSIARMTAEVVTGTSVALVRILTTGMDAKTGNSAKRTATKRSSTKDKEADSTNPTEGAQAIRAETSGTNALRIRNTPLWRSNPPARRSKRRASWKFLPKVSGFSDNGIVGLPNPPWTSLSPQKSSASMDCGMG